LSEKFEVVWDDRDDVSAGVKFNDADLLGMPVRIVVSEKTLAQKSVEVKARTKNDSTIVSMEKEELFREIVLLVK